MKCYAQAEEPNVVADSIDESFTKALKVALCALQSQSCMARTFHRIFHGWSYPEKLTVTLPELEDTVMQRLRAGYYWAVSNKYKVQVFIGDHVERGFGVSVGFRIKESDEQGWACLEQVVIRSDEDDFVIYRYRDDE